MIDIQSTDLRILVNSCLTSTFVITLRYDIYSKERQNCSPIAVLGGSLDGEPKPILPIEKVRRKGLGLLSLLLTFCYRFLTFLNLKVIE